MWSTWLSVNMPALRLGAKLEVPGWLAPPGSSGFQRIQIANSAGQIADWGLALADGSRIHVHEFSDGRLVAHRDKFDPAQGPGNLFAHLFMETGWGIGLVIAALAIKAASEN